MSLTEFSIDTTATDKERPSSYPTSAKIRHQASFIACHDDAVLSDLAYKDIYDKFGMLAFRLISDGEDPSQIVSYATQATLNKIILSSGQGWVSHLTRIVKL